MRYRTFDKRYRGDHPMFAHECEECVNKENEIDELKNTLLEEIIYEAEEILKIHMKDEKRYYEIDGLRYPSVTTILGIIGKPWLAPWAVKATCDYLERGVAEEILTRKERGLSHLLLSSQEVHSLIGKARKESIRIRDEAASVGSDIHEAISRWAKAAIAGKEFSISFFDKPQHQKAWEAFVWWARHVNLRPMRTEQTVANKALLYAGTMDLAATISLPEWGPDKKKNRLYLIDVKTSSAFYEVPMGPQVAAYEKCFHEKEFDGIGLLRLDKATGLPHFHDLTKDRGRYFNVFRAARNLYSLLEKEPIRGKRAIVPKGNVGAARNRKKAKTK